MIAYKPVPFHLGQPRPSQETLPSLPDPDLTFVGFTGLPGVVETLAVLAATSAGAWIGIRAGLREKDPYYKYAGWVGGIGAALAGLLYLGAKTGLGQDLGLPAVRVSPA